MPRRVRQGRNRPVTNLLQGFDVLLREETAHSTKCKWLVTTKQQKPTGMRDVSLLQPPVDKTHVVASSVMHTSRLPATLGANVLAQVRNPDPLVLLDHIQLKS